MVYQDYLMRLSQFHLRINQIIPYILPNIITKCKALLDLIQGCFCLCKMYIKLCNIYKCGVIFFIYEYCKNVTFFIIYVIITVMDCKLIQQYIMGIIDKFPVEN